MINLTDESRVIFGIVNFVSLDITLCDKLNSFSGLDLYIISLGKIKRCLLLKWGYE